MIEKRRIACFFTAGYTELNAMKSFMRKINDTVEYIQLCPTGPRKSRRAIQNRRLPTAPSLRLPRTKSLKKELNLINEMEKI